MDNKVRLFFALWPDKKVRQSIINKSKPLLKGVQKKIPAHNLHITLAFIGNVEKSKLDCYRQAAQEVHASGFGLRLDKAGCFSRAQILWLGCTTPAAELNWLVDSLNSALAVCGYQPGERRFTPHVSLTRKYRERVIPEFDTEIDWPVDSFCLVESCSTGRGVEYRVLDTWALG